MARQARQAAQFVRVDEDEEEESFVATRQVEMTSAGAMPVATGDTHDLLQRGMLRLGGFRRLDSIARQNAMQIACGAAGILLVLLFFFLLATPFGADATSGGGGSNTSVA